MASLGAVGERMRSPQVSRRMLIAGSSAIALWRAPSAAASEDSGAKLLRRWLDLDAKIMRLQDRWARLEDWLAREHAWFELSRAEQRTLPRARELDDIDGVIETLIERRDDLLAALPAVRSRSLQSIQLRLAVAERLICPDVHPETHCLIAGARQDLVAMSDGAG